MAANAWLERAQGAEAAGSMTRTVFVLAAATVPFAGAECLWLIPSTNVTAVCPHVGARQFIRASPLSPAFTRSRCALKTPCD